MSFNLNPNMKAVSKTMQEQNGTNYIKMYSFIYFEILYIIFDTLMKTSHSQIVVLKLTFYKLINRTNLGTLAI